MKVKIGRNKTGHIKGLSIMIFCCALFLLCLQPVFATEGKIIMSDDKTAGIPIIYGIVCFVSFILVICGYIVGKRYIKIIMLSVFVFICNLGYFALSVSDTLQGALMANRVTYLGAVFMMLFMLLIIMDICGVKASKPVTGLLASISGVVFLIAASGGITDIYYRDVELVIINGTSGLAKEYGPMHSAYYAYVFLYFLAMIVVILYAVIKKKSGVGRYAAFFAAAVLGNIGIWLSEQFLSEHFEFLSISYVVTEMLLMFMQSIMSDNDEDNAKAQDEALSCSEASPRMKLLTAREQEVAMLLLEDKKRKEIAEELGITEHTVKKHTANIFSKMEVGSRKELISLFEDD
ncbi:MAG: LuxR C-terminal-related transcriptional regulator [Firmicutes bacterium]|nr:LuxR C-terminal-related transcriptional regulator [Bacillota bacterium]